MPRYVAFLRGVSPMNAKMPELKRAFESAGFINVKTVLSSGNVVFDSRAKSDVALARQAEKAMQEHLDRTFLTIVRSTKALPVTPMPAGRTSSAKRSRVTTQTTTT